MTRNYDALQAAAREVLALADDSCLFAETDAPPDETCELTWAGRQALDALRGALEPEACQAAAEQEAGG